MGLYRAHQADSLLEFPCSAPCPSLLLRAMKRSLDAMRMTDDEQWDWLEELTGFKCAARPPQSTAPSGAVGAEPKRTTVRSRTIREEPTQGTDSPQESQKRPEPSAKVQEEPKPKRAKSEQEQAIAPAEQEQARDSCRTVPYVGTYTHCHRIRRSRGDRICTSRASAP